ncbi:MAG: hypothetical protein CL938_02360 [Deltaproteobacteria bacterium]|nr:hypothetical protein [Deltaproteobacteria bacterium]
MGPIIDPTTAPIIMDSSAVCARLAAEMELPVCVWAVGSGGKLPPDGSTWGLLPTPATPPGGGTPAGAVGPTLTQPASVIAAMQAKTNWRVGWLAMPTYRSLQALLN